MGIEHQRTVQEATFYNPLEDFAATTVEMEIREDPLTGRQSRIVPDNFLIPEEEPDIESVVTDDEGCFFCPEMVDETTPKYPDFVGMDRGAVGEATSFPNLNPYGTHSNVVVLTEDHYVPIGEFTEDIFTDGLQAALEYVTAVFEHENDPQIGSVNMNYLRSAGSSIIHPHLQTLVDDRGTNEQRARLEGARSYHEETDGNYFADLVDEERDTARQVGTIGDVEWIAPFAPRHHRHFMGILPDSSIPDPDAEAVRNLAAGIVNVLEYFADVGLNSFNVGLHLFEDEPATRPVLDVVARSVFDQYYWSDATFFETVHDEGVVDVAPETYAEEAAAFF